MEITETADSKKLIPILYFNICHEDGLTRQEISKMYRREDATTHKSCFFLEKFEHHLKVRHKLSLRDYCKKYLQQEWPRCPINGNEVGYKISGKGLQLYTFNAATNKEFSPKFREYCDRISEERRGEGNPMFGKPSWNQGLTAESNETLKRMAETNTGRKASEETKTKQREKRKLSPIKARHTTPHSEETREKLRISTARLWSEGTFNRTTSIHVKMREFLRSLNLQSEFTEEYQVKYFSLDFAFPEIKVGVECQGTFYHVDPRIYPDGPKNAIQRRNFGRDKAKRKYLEKMGWKVLEVWETEINDGTFKEDLICRLLELKALKN